MKIVNNGTEAAVYVDGVGALFISTIGERLFVEAAALNNGDEPREVVQQRHDTLAALVTHMFGEGLEFIAPLAGARS